MLGASVTSLGWTLSAPLGVTKPDFSWISTVAAVDSMSPKTTQPAVLVTPWRVCGEAVPVGVKVTITVTPATPSVGAGSLPTSTSSPEPVGGVMMLDRLTSGRFAMPSRGQVTLEVIWTLAAFCLLVSMALQPVVLRRAVAGRRFLGDFVGRAVDRLGVFVRAGLDRLERADGVRAHLLLGLGGEDHRLVVGAVLGLGAVDDVKAVERGDDDQRDEQSADDHLHQQEALLCARLNTLGEAIADAGRGSASASGDEVGAGSAGENADRTGGWRRKCALLHEPTGLLTLRHARRSPLARRGPLNTGTSATGSPHGPRIAAPRGTGVSVTRRSPKPQREVRLLGSPSGRFPVNAGIRLCRAELVRCPEPHGSARIRFRLQVLVSTAVPWQGVASGPLE